MNDLHRLAAEVALVLALLAVGWSALALARGRPLSQLAIANLAWVALIAIVAALLGLVVLATGSGPHDALHLVYAALAIVALPLTAWVAAGRAARQRTVAGFVGSLVELILVVRLFQTGG